LVVVTRYRLDGDALAALCHAHADLRVLSTTTSTKIASVVCRHRQPDVVLLDASLDEGDECASIGSFAREIGNLPILLLDDEINSSRLASILELPQIGYFTRAAPFPELVNGLRRLVDGERVFDSIVENLVHQAPNGWQFRPEESASPLAVLTPREIEVWRLVALGNTVKHCAHILELAPSTVDNHKSRLMKKLGIHKSLELTRLAIRTGLIRV
jgi:DNA-binding NarL/FixJ family response regulator